VLSVWQRRERERLKGTLGDRISRDNGEGGSSGERKVASENNGVGPENMGERRREMELRFYQNGFLGTCQGRSRGEKKVKEEVSAIKKNVKNTLSGDQKGTA